MTLKLDQRAELARAVELHQADLLDGASEIIAFDQSNFIKIAVHLGMEPDWRRSVSERFVKQTSMLETDMAYMRSLEGILERAAAKTEKLTREPAT